METFVNVKDKTIKLSVDYTKGNGVYLHAIPVELNKWGYSCDIFQGKFLCQVPMTRKNQKTINAITEKVLQNKEEIAKLFAEGKIEEAKTLAEKVCS